jgi:Spy/CpxP family protein refolding chaperone
MKTFTLVAAIAVAFVCITARAHSPTPAPKSDADLKRQIAELQAKVKQLETAASPHASPSSSPSMPGMTSSPGGSMSMEHEHTNSMPSSSPSMSSMPSNPMSGGMMMEMMKMMGHMNMGPMSSASSGMTQMPQSALPGFPGISHLYHIGATGFFLDHADHIKLSPDQQTSLSRLKEQALGAKAQSDHQIERAEEELGQLTSSDQPDAGKIEQKVREIEKLRSEQRLAFIRAVGDAAKLLTDDQRKILVGALQPNTAMPSPTMSPMPHM